MKKRNTIPYILLAIAVLIALFYGIQANNLGQKLRTLEAEHIQAAQTLKTNQQLLHIDSMLVKGEYNGALRAYTEEIRNKDMDDVAGVRLRIDIARQLMRLRDGSAADNALLAKKDSIDSVQVARYNSIPNEIKQYDSLSFALEKAQVQLTRIKRQLRKKSFGEYLTFTSAKGSQMHYVGQVRNGEANGVGVAILNTGSRYEGDWKANQRHGEGTFYWPDGEYYVGSYINDLRNGQGTYHWPNGEKYVGLWKDDKRNGRGVFYGTDGEVITSGLWKNDKLVKEDKKK